MAPLTPQEAALEALKRTPYTSNKSDQLIFTVGQTNYGADGKPLEKSITTVGQVNGYLYTLAQTNPTEYDRIVQRMSTAGLDVSDRQKIQKNWEDAVDASAKSYSSGYYRLDPFAAIELVGSYKGQSQLPEISITDTSNIATNLTISTEQQARGALVSTSQQLLGRDPTKNEVKLFTRALNSMQRANPETTQTSGQQVSQPVGSEIVQTGTGSAQLNRGSTSTTSSSVETGGFDTGQYSIDTAKSANDYAEYQAETTFMNALLSAIQSPVNI